MYLETIDDFQYLILEAIISMRVLLRDNNLKWMKISNLVQHNNNNNNNNKFGQKYKLHLTMPLKTMMAPDFFSVGVNKKMYLG